MQLTAERLSEADLAASLASGWTLARDANVTPVAPSPLTPLTRLAPPIRVIVPAREREPMTAPPTVIRRRTRPRSRAACAGDAAAQVARHAGGRCLRRSLRQGSWRLPCRSSRIDGRP